MMSDAEVEQLIREAFPPEEEKDYVVTLTVQVVVKSVSAGCARCEAIDLISDMITTTEYPNDPQNCYTVDSVERIGLEDDI